MSFQNVLCEILNSGLVSNLASEVSCNLKCIAQNVSEVMAPSTPVSNPDDNDTYQRVNLAETQQKKQQI